MKHSNETTKKTAVIYTRVSTDEQAEKGYSLADQKETIERYANQRNVEILEHYQDDHSAKTFDRPEYQKMLTFMEKNRSKIDYLIFSRWDRFSRNAAEALHMISKLRDKLNIEPISVEAPIDYNDPNSIILLALQLATPQAENQRRGLNTTMGMRRALKAGRMMGVAPRGYKNQNINGHKTVIIDPEVAPLVVKGFREVAKGLKTRAEVWKELRKEGYTGSQNQFFCMLKNPNYYGKVVVPAYKDEPEELVDGIHEPLVSYELFQRVQQVTAKRASPPARKKEHEELLALRGHLICDHCGNVMTASTSTNPQGKEYSYYHCQPGTKCKHRKRAEVVHVGFAEYLQTFTMKPEVMELYKEILIDKINVISHHTTQEQKEFNKALKNLQTQRDRLDEQLMEGKIRGEDYSRLQEKLKKKEADLLQQQDEQPQPGKDFKKHIEYSYTLLKDLNGYYQTSTTRVKKMITSSIFPEKVIFDGTNYRTEGMNEVAALLYRIDKDFRKGKKKKAANSGSLSRQVAPTRIELVSKV